MNESMAGGSRDAKWSSGLARTFREGLAFTN